MPHWDDLAVIVSPVAETPLGEIRSSWQVVTVDTLLIIVHRADVSVFDRGRFLRRVGSAGAGPGEIRQATRSGVGNSGRLWIWDQLQRRLVELDDSAKRFTGLRYPEVSYASASGADWSGIGGISRDGRLIMIGMGDDFRSEEGSKPRAGSGRSYGLIGVANDADDAPRVVARTPINGDCSFAIGQVGVSVPQCQHSLSAVAIDGSSIATLSSRTGDNRATGMMLTRVSLSGDTLVHRFIALPAPELSSRDLDTLFTRLVARVPIVASVGPRSQVPFPKRWAMAHQILLGADGSTWVKGGAIEGGYHWFVVGSDGDPIGRIAIPDDILLSEVSKASALVAEDLPTGQIRVSRIHLSAPSADAMAPINPWGLAGSIHEVGSGGK